MNNPLTRPHPTKTKQNYT